MSPDPTAVATSGAVMVGRNETRKKRVKNAWFAADCPASANVTPNLPTQNVSTLLTIGTTAMLSMDGTAAEIICWSTSS